MTSPFREAVATAIAGIVTLVPEGLVLLDEHRLRGGGRARRPQRSCSCSSLHAVEALAGVDIVCLDKTGTLTDGTLRCEEVLPLGGTGESDVRELPSAQLAASLGAATRPRTRSPRRSAGSGASRPAEVPFSSRWKWSGLHSATAAGWCWARPRCCSAMPTAHATRCGPQSRRVARAAFGVARAAIEPEGGRRPRLPEIAPLALRRAERAVAPGRRATTVEFLHGQGVDVKVISGDGPATVAAVARAPGSTQPAGRGRAATLPDDPAELAGGARGTRCLRG